MSTRPADWALIAESDPCPGNPDAWGAAAAHWDARRIEANTLRQRLTGYFSIPGQGNRIRGTEVAFTEGATLISLMMDQFDQARLSAQGWGRALADMQTRADAALARAQSAQIRKDEAEQKIAYYKAEAAKDDSPDPLISLKLGGLFGLGGWEWELAEAEQQIASERRLVEEIRGEYKQAVENAKSGYSLETLTRVYDASGKSAPFAHRASVLKSLGVFDLTYLEALEMRAGSSVEDMRIYLDALSMMSPEELKQYFEAHPELTRYPMDMPDAATGSAAAVKEWWAALSKEQRGTLIEVAPGVVGNLNGVSYDARDRANRWLLEQVLVDPNTDPSTVDDLKALRDAAVSEDDQSERYITSLDLSNIKLENEDNYGYNNVLASVSLGSVDEADKVSVVVPGMTNNVEDMDELTDAGLNIYQEQKRAQEVRGDGEQNLAVVLWIGYESPPNLGMQAHPQQMINNRLVTDISLAETGGQRLADFTDGLNVTKSQTTAVQAPDAYSDPFVSIIAHSYGTTVVGEAMQVAETKVDNLVLYGSAGIGIGSVGDANAERWAVEHDEQGRQQIFYTDSVEDWTAPFGYLPGRLDGAIVPWISKEPRYTPRVIGDAQRFQSTEALTADGVFWVMWILILWLIRAIMRVLCT